MKEMSLNLIKLDQYVSSYVKLTGKCTIAHCTSLQLQLT